MIADTIDFYVFSVQWKTLGTVKVKVSDSECCFISIPPFPIILQFCDCLVEAGWMNRPKCRIFHSKNMLDINLIMTEGFFIRSSFSNFSSLLIEDWGFDGEVFVIWHLVSDGWDDWYFRIFPGYFRSSDKSTPMVNKYLIHGYQPYIPVNSRSWIPAWIRLLWIIHFDCQYIWLPVKIQIGSQLIPERDISVGTFAQVMSIDPDFTVAVYTVKINEKQFCAVSGRNSKCFAVPSDSAW